MKTILATSFAVLVFASLPAHAGLAIINLGISGEVSPGVYGQVQLGNAPPPQVVYAQPVIIVRQRDHEHERPLYLHVPPGQAKHWSRYCRDYNACDRPVYFVRSAEYEPGYNAREYRKHHNKDRGNHGDRDHKKRGDRGHDRRD